jgi:hypothetical protein
MQAIGALELVLFKKIIESRKSLMDEIKGFGTEDII